MRAAYSPRCSPLHAARASVGAAWCAAIVVAALLLASPVVLVTLLVVVLGGAQLAGVREEVIRALRWALPFALVFALLNPLWSHDGLTVVARLGEVGPFGEVDVTLESIVYGLVIGLQIVVVLLATRLMSLCVDADELLRSSRRVSFHSALTAALATRMVPILAADSRRLAEAQRARGRSPQRLAIVGAVVGGALDRSLDVAATLEVRGYGSTRRAPRYRRPWSRHDLAFAASAAAIALLALFAHLAGVASFEPYPTIQVALGAPAALLCAALTVVALLPFADRRGVG